MSMPITTYPPFNNRGVVQTGKSTFILKHPDDTSSATVPMTVKVGAIFEYRDAIFKAREAYHRVETRTFVY